MPAGSVLSGDGGDRSVRNARDMIVVFGAGGFIGTYLIDQFVRDGYEIIASDFSEIGEAYYSKRGVRHHRIDITRSSEFERLPKSGIEAVVHLACVQPANVSEQKYDPRDYIRVNVLGTLNILEFCRANRVPKIIYACSHRNTQGMWAEKSGEPIRESDGRSIKFTGEYAMFSISESAAMDCVEHYSRAYGIEGICLRLPPVYGYGPHTEIFKDGKPLKTGFQMFIESAKKGLPIVLWGDPATGRDIVYVKDVVAAFGLALKTSGAAGLYNISSGRCLSLKEQAECIVRVFSPPGTPSEIQFRPDKPNFIETYVYDIDKARRVLGWQPRYSFEDMLIDYQSEMESGRFAFLVDKRRALIQGAQGNR
jgi:UDP-glucose 4-epimerase